MKKTDKEKMAFRLKELLEKWENNPLRMKSGFAYEQTFVEMMQTFEKELFQEFQEPIQFDDLTEATTVLNRLDKKFGFKK